MVCFGRSHIYIYIYIYCCEVLAPQIVAKSKPCAFAVTSNGLMLPTKLHLFLVGKRVENCNTPKDMLLTLFVFYINAIGAHKHCSNQNLGKHACTSMTLTAFSKILIGAFGVEWDLLLESFGLACFAWEIPFGVLLHLATFASHPCLGNFRQEYFNDVV